MGPAASIALAILALGAATLCEGAQAEPSPSPTAASEGYVLGAECAQVTADEVTCQVTISEGGKLLSQPKTTVRIGQPGSVQHGAMAGDRFVTGVRLVILFETAQRGSGTLEVWQDGVLTQSTATPLFARTLSPAGRLAYRVATDCVREMLGIQCDARVTEVATGQLAMDRRLLLPAGGRGSVSSAEHYREVRVEFILDRSGNGWAMFTATRGGVEVEHQRLFVTSRTGETEAGGGEPISIDLANTPLSEVLERFRRFSGRTIVADVPLKGSVTVKFADVPWRQALRAILRDRGLDLRETSGTLRVVKP